MIQIVTVSFFNCAKNLKPSSRMSAQDNEYATCRLLIHPYSLAVTSVCCETRRAELNSSAFAGQHSRHCICSTLSQAFATPNLCLCLCLAPWQFLPADHFALPASKSALPKLLPPSNQSRKLATPIAKPLLLLSRSQLRCFAQPGRASIMTAALASQSCTILPGRAPPSRTTHRPSTAPMFAPSLQTSPNIPLALKLWPKSSRTIATIPSPYTTSPLLFGARAASTITEGHKLPEANLSYFDKDGNVHTVTISDLTRAKKVVLFAVPGAFTPTCSTQHLPGFIAKAEELRKAGVDVLACVSVNDAFVMRAWGEQMNVGESVLLLSDGLGCFTKAMGATVDLSDKPVGLGVRSRRYSMLVDDGVVKVMHMEEGGAFTTSGAEGILEALHKGKTAPQTECSKQNVA